MPVDYLAGNGRPHGAGIFALAMRATSSAGTLLREWRQRRRMTQMDLALQAEISARHLSFLETGHAQPSREMLMHLAEEFEIPLRSRNELLVSAGFAPVFAQRPLTDPALHAARAAIDLVLQAQRPYPAFALDRHWNVVASNGALPQLYEGVDAALPPRSSSRRSTSCA
jgi:transcriptional regulator with XRE-family HTH domain